MEKQEEQAVIVRVVAHLNELTGARYRPKAVDAQRHMLARLHEGRSEQDMLDVVDAMCALWLGNETMERYLRPQTLFGTKMESYLNTARLKKKKTAPAATGRFRDASDLLGD
ncbi:MAG: conserved phage C-terminal domain-containing protein [Ethanoligenens sp.]